MNSLEKLIAKHCPNGVEYKPLGKVCVIKNGKDYKSFGDGNYPVYGSGGIMTYVDRYVYSKPTVLIPRKGSIENIFYVDVPFWNVDTIFYTEIDETLIEPKYLYYFMLTVDLRRLNNGGGVPSLTQTGLYTVLIAVPPLPVQREIVRMLDDMTGLISAIEEEIEARKKQYVWCRDKMLKLDGVERKTLGTLGSFYGGLSGKSKDDFVGGNARFISYMNVFSNASTKLDMEDYVKVSNTERQNIIEYGDVLFTGSSETREESGMSSVVTLAPKEDIYLNSFCFGFRFTDKSIFEPVFLKHLLRADVIRKQIWKTASGVTRFNVSKARMTGVELPVPTLPIQKKMAAKLDDMTNLIAALEEELVARKQQYEYYRDMLLTFKRKGGGHS